MMDVELDLREPSDEFLEHLVLHVWVSLCVAGERNIRAPRLRSVGVSGDACPYLRPFHTYNVDAGTGQGFQYCCRWVTPLGGGDDPVVYLIDTDDFTGESRAPYVDSFTAYTEADVWDARLFRADDNAWSFDHELRPDAVATLGTMLERRPTTFGWAHNQGCEAVYRFDGAARAAIAVAGTKALWTITSATALRDRIMDILGVPPDDRP
jgi:hypothetical protein